MNSYFTEKNTSLYTQLFAVSMYLIRCGTAVMHWVLYSLTFVTEASNFAVLIHTKRYVQTFLCTCSKGTL